MRFLADESCDFRVVRALRAVGHDVVAVSEVTPGADDATIVDKAVREQRIFLTGPRFRTTCLCSRKADGWHHTVAFSFLSARRLAGIGRGRRRQIWRKAGFTLHRT
jgi:uncharacterized protein with PIN domain